MKRLTAWALLLAMVVAIFAGCSTTEPTEAPTTAPTAAPTTAPTAAPTEPDNTAEALENARAYLKTMYKSKAGKVTRDFDLVSVVRVGNDSYDVVWTTDAAEYVTVGAPVDGVVTVTIGENLNEEDVNFTLTATISAKNLSESVSFEFYIPGTPAKASGPVFVDAPVVGAAYKFALVQAERGETLYFTGEMSGNYLAMSTNVLDAVNVSVEETEGGYHLYFVKNGVKTYIDVQPREDNAAKVNIKLVEEPTAVYTWDAERKTLITTVGENTWYMGTYGTYNTISCSNVSYIEDISKIGVSQFPAGFATYTYDIATVDAPVAGASYKFFLTQAERGETLYFNGEMSGNYLAMSTDPLEGVDVIVEEVEGGYHLYFVKDGVKTYIDVQPREDNAAKVNIKLVEEPTALYTWDAERKTMITTVGENTWYMGTYGTYNTISCSNVSYIEDISKIGVSQFPATFATINFTFTPNEGEATVGSSYVFALTQAERGEVLYFAGAMSGNYFATTTNAAQAVKVTVEEVEGGYRFFFMDGETKTYIDINEYAEGKAGVRLTTEPTAVFTWNDECKVYVANVAGADRYLGTYSTYNTISASDIKYIAGENLVKIGVSQFPAQFGTAAP